LREYFEYRTLPDMKRRRFDRTLSLKCADPLFTEILADAARLGVSLSEAARRKLVDAYAQRMTDRVAAPAQPMRELHQ
jgi:hypothetical protein